MRKVIAAINMTVDGFCDHQYGIADDDLHEHYNDLLRNAGALLYGRTTYQLMASYWPDLVKNPSGNKTEDDFAVLIDNIPKIVFSRTMKDSGWRNATIAKGNLPEEVNALKQQPGKDVFIGSPGLIAQLTKMNMIDEFQLCIHPVIAGKGLPLFKDIEQTSMLKLLNTKTLASGAIVLYYKPVED